MIRRRVRYEGRVQGVGFRATAHAIASRRAVTGWVRNEPDGSVALEVQGDEAEVEEFLGALRARMERLVQSERVERAETESSESSFVVRC